MTAFEGTNQNLAWDSGLQADDLDVSFGTYMSAAASDFWGYNPSVAHSRAYDVYASQVDMDTLDVDSDAMSFDPSAISRREGMGLDDQKAWIEKEGLTGHLVPQEGYNEDTLKLLAEAKHRERENAMIREAAPAWMAVPGFVAGLGMSFLDPINLASGFFPVVGQARQMQMLSRASGVWGATARRAGIGLAEGTVGAMAVEPIIQLGRSAEQADWEMSQSVLNIAFGSIIGATMHVGKGAFGDLMRLKNRQRQPWESAPSTDSTEALRTSFVDDLYEAAQEAGANITREQAIEDSIVFDAHARAWAYDTGRTPEEYYRTRRPDFRAAIARDAENFEKAVGAELEGIAAEDAAPVEGRADAGAEEGIMPAETAGKQGDTAEAAIAEIREASAAETPAVEAQPPATRFYTAESGATRYRGDDVSILNGHEKENARYELRELSDVIPSHDPEAQFARRADYPENVQERPYHSDAGEQQKVLRNAATLEPGYLVNNNPDAVNGPPIITEEGIVLGGNSRTMSIQLAYASHPERAEAYRSSLKKWGQMFGIDPAAVDSFQRPVLVRVVEGGQDAQAMAVKSRLYNQSQTQGLQAKAEGVSKGKLVSRETLDALTQGMEDFDTLRGFMASPKSKEFIQALFNDGVIEQTQLHRLTDEHGLLNDAGKDLVENALRGHIVQDYDVLAAAPAAVLANLDRSLPGLARLKARREGWDMSGVVTRALKLINRAQKEDRALEIMLSQGSMAGDTAKAGVQAMALTLKNATSKEVQLRFNALADAAERTHRGQSVMVLAQAANDTPAKAFIRTFMKPIASVDGEPVPAFNPSGNARHAAIQYVYENGGKGRSVSVAEEALQKTIASRKTPKEAKAEARAMLGELSQLDGSVAIYEPQLGPYFRYKQGEELWQSSAHRESSIAAVRKQYEGTDKWMMAPNGKATNLSEQQWLIVRTPEFKRWFGDWEADPANASKVVDANGEPLVVFHGSPEKNIEVFANHSQLEGHESGHRSTGDAGIYTSPRRSYAERYTAADLASDESSGGRVYELYLNIRRPATLVEAGLSHPDKITAEKAAELREQGYDGIMYEHRKRPEYIVLDPRQIKSTENRGSFDPENPNSLYQGKASRNAEALRDIERQYDEAVAKNDMQRAGELVVQYSRLKGYAPESDYRMSHRAPDASYPDEIPSLRQIAEGFDLVPDDFWTHPERYMPMGEWDRESIAAIRSAMDDLKNGGEGKVTMYRAVSSDVKEGSFRNSDWITPSREYAMEHIRHSLNGKGRIIEMEVKAEDIYWDGNSINEWGYDDRQSYAYRNTKNNRKSLAPVTRDENGNVIPLTKRFNERNPDVLYQGGTLYQFLGERGARNLDHTQQVTTRIDNLGVAREMEAAGKDAKAVKLATGWERGADGKWRYEVLDGKANEVLWSVDKGGTFHARLEDVLDAPEIFAAYPELKDVSLLVENRRTDTKGSYSAAGKSIFLQRSMFERPGEENLTRLKQTEEYKKYKERLDKNAARYLEGVSKKEVLAEQEKIDAEFYGTETGHEFKAAQERQDVLVLSREARSVLLHEIQHAIQEIEGFARGGNPELMARRNHEATERQRAASLILDTVGLENEEGGVYTFESAATELFRDAVGDPYSGGMKDPGLADALEYILRQPDIEAAVRKLHEESMQPHDNRTPSEQYRALGGETESRNVQARMDMTAEERRASPASETEDVARADQILLGQEEGEGVSMSMEERASDPVVPQEMYPSTQNEKPLHPGVASLDEVYAMAAASKDDFQNGVRSIAEATGGKALLRPGDGLKTRDRAQKKISRDYGDAPGAHNRVVDILGGTLLYKGRSEISAALPEIQRGIESMGGQIIRIKDRFLNPVSGYKDLLINIRMKNGLVTELLVTTEEMAAAKNGIGHKLYEMQQEIGELIPEATPEEKAILNELDGNLRKASELYYGTTGDQSNATASASVILNPLYEVSARLEDMSSSSMYPRLSSKLENIWKNPSLENTKGISSYSQNSGSVRESMETAGASGKKRAGIEKLSDMEDPSLGSDSALPHGESVPENARHGKELPDLSDVAEADRAFIEQGPKYSGDVAETARARVIFNATEDGRAVIEFFKSADASSAPHELYHIFRRELEETANMEGVSERAKRMWRDACEFVGAEPGQKWTVEMEEKFAKAGERFLMEGKAPIPALQGLFDKMKQWFTEIYQNADEAGLEISDGMRRMFGEMLTPSAEEADAMFRYSLGKILESDPSEGMDTRIDLPEDTGDARQVLAEAQADAQGRVERQLEGFAERLPEEDIAAFRDEYNEAMAMEDEAIRQAEQRGELLREAAACDLGGM